MKRPKTYGTSKAAELLGISKPTLLRWFADKKVKDVARDHRKWRVFTDADIRRIRKGIFGNA